MDLSRRLIKEAFIIQREILSYFIFFSLVGSILSSLKIIICILV